MTALPQANKTRFFRYHLPIFVILISGFAITFLLAQWIEKEDINQSQEQFERLATNLSFDLHKSIQINLEVIESFHDFYASANEVTKEGFEKFASGIFSRHRDIRTLEWLPLVRQSEALEFETKVSAEFNSPYQIKSFSENPDDILKNPKDEYFPVHYAHPFEKYKELLGVDISSDPERLSALQSARDSGIVRTTTPIKLFHDARETIGFMVVRALYKKNAALETVEQRRANLTGFIAGIWRMDDFIRASLNIILLDEVDFYLFEGDSISKDALFYHFSSSTDSFEKIQNSTVYWRASFPVAQHEWTILYVPQPKFFKDRLTQKYWLVWMFGSMITLFLTSYLILILRRRVFIEKIVHKRTLELSDLNKELQGQILERHQTEEALRRSEQKYKQVTTNIPGAVYQFILTPDRRMLFPYMSESISRIVGLTAEEIRQDGSRPFTHIIPEDLPSVNESIYKSAQEMETWLKEFRIKTVSGDLKWLRATSSPQPMHDGSILWNGVILDISDLKNAESQLKEVNEELKRKEKKLLETLEDLRKAHQGLKETQVQLIQIEKMDSVGRLAAGVAHEVKNPLAIIMQCVDYLSLSSELLERDPTLKGVIADMSDAIERADSVIVELLDFASQPETKMLKEDLNSLVEESLLLVKHELEKNHIGVIKNLSTVPSIRINKNRILQVFVNLFLNAIYAMRENGALKISTRLENIPAGGLRIGRHKGDFFKPASNVVVAEIEDNGSGIPEDIKDKIFEPFFTTRRGKGGTGLGLSVVRSIMEMHRGTVEIDNNPNGIGAKVTLKFHVFEEVLNG